MILRDAMSYLFSEFASMIIILMIIKPRENKSVKDGTFKSISDVE